MTLELKKFSMQNITFKADENKGPVIVLIGRRDTGKSYLVRDLLYYHQDIPGDTRHTAQVKCIPIKEESMSEDIIALIKENVIQGRRTKDDEGLDENMSGTPGVVELTQLALDKNIFLETIII